MDPLTTVLIALGTGATVTVQAATTNEKVKEIYQELRSRVYRRFEDKQVDNLALEEYENKPSLPGRKQLKKALVEAEVAQDDEIVETAQDLLEHVEPEPAPAGKYEVLPVNIVRGYNEGNYESVIINFASENRGQQRFD